MGTPSPAAEPGAEWLRVARRLGVPVHIGCNHSFVAVHRTGVPILFFQRLGDCGGPRRPAGGGAGLLRGPPRSISAVEVPSPQLWLLACVRESSCFLLGSVVLRRARCKYRAVGLSIYCSPVKPTFSASSNAPEMPSHTSSFRPQTVVPPSHFTDGNLKPGEI